MTVGHDGGRDNERTKYNATLVSPPVSLALDSPLPEGAFGFCGGPQTKASPVQGGSDPSAASGRKSEVSEWQRSKFWRLIAAAKFWAPQQEVATQATEGLSGDCAVQIQMDATAA